MKRVRDMDESDSSREGDKQTLKKKTVQFEESSLTRGRAKATPTSEPKATTDNHKHEGDCCNHGSPGGHSHGHSHSYRSANPTSIPEDYKSSIQFKEFAFPKSLDVVALAYPVFVLILAYGALIFKDHIVNEEAYDKFHERIEHMSKQTAITSQLLISEIFKHFPVLAFTTLSTFYLIKPIKGSSSAEKAIVKKHNDILAKLKNEKQSITPEMERRLDSLIADRTSLKISRYIEYNALMVQINKFNLCLDFQLSLFGYVIFISQRILYSSFFPFFSFYYESMMVGLQAWKLGVFLLVNYYSEDYKFRRIMLGLFLGVFTLGKIFELVQVSAYHESHLEAVLALVAVTVVYGLARIFINESKSAIGTRKCLYWAFVGDLVKEYSSTR